MLIYFEVIIAIKNQDTEAALYHYKEFTVYRYANCQFDTVLVLAS
ncbi:MAG: hypothetical protein ACI90V_008355 [Bacillariaceae sp.]|jgi:hypothetical protein